jgi:hypothetical protein
VARKETFMASLFRPAIDLLKQYAEYHRDRRNIVTHFVGVPMVVFAIGVFLAGVSFTLGGWPSRRPGWCSAWWRCGT